MTRSQAKSGSTSPSRDRLRPFKLAEIPLDIRLAAARHARVAALPDDTVDARDRLFAALTEIAGAEPEEVVLEREALARVARSPSDRVYWIPAAAWEKVMGDSAWGTVMGS